METMKKRQNHINLGDIDKKRNDKGRLICLNCDKLLKGRQQKYCGWDCSHEWMCKHDQSFMRSKIIVKVNQICNHCKNQFHKGDLILDHITPIAIGGEEFDENNLQILCIGCNKIKTKQDHHNIAEYRRSNKTEFKEQKKVGDFLSPKGESLIAINQN